jgi:acylphosphatase
MSRAKAFWRLKFEVEGKVQGVFFRAHTKEEADRLGLFGWVKNDLNSKRKVVGEAYYEAAPNVKQLDEDGPASEKINPM